MSDNPYQSPKTVAPANLGSYSISGLQYQFKSIRGLAIALSVCVALNSMLAFLVSVLELVFESIWPGFNDPNLPFANQSAEMAGWSFTALALLSLFPLLAIVIIGPMFSYRSNANLRSLGVRTLEFTPGWCAGFWFIPIVNLYRPYMATCEVYHASENSLQKKGSAVMSPFLGLWWTCFLLGSILSNIENRMALRGVYHAESFHVVSFLSSTLMVCAAILFVRIVLRISANQTEAAGRMIR